MMEIGSLRELHITPTRSRDPLELPLLPINERQKSPNHKATKANFLLPLLVSSFFQTANRLEFIKDLILKLEPTSTQRKKGKKTGSRPIQGLNRTGKSCRLRWVNYLHPGLKRGRMSPHEERLILELHARWGNRWSRIARRLPGRTDNEIKNYWRTHMRKKAQERKRNMSPSSSSSSLTYQSCHPETPSIIGIDEQELHGGSSCITSILKGTPADMDGYPMDQIWREIETPEAPSGPSFDEGKDNAYSSLSGPLLPSPMWDYYCPEARLKMDDENKMAPQFGYSTGMGPCY